MKLKNGTTSVFHILKEKGIDAEDYVNEIKAGLDLFSKAGLSINLTDQPYQLKQAEKPVNEDKKEDDEEITVINGDK